MMRSLILIFSLFVFNFGLAHAAEIYFTSKTQNIHRDDVFVVEARVSSTDELINVADGSFLFDKERLEIREISTGGSVFNLWADGPSFSNTEGRVSFVGGSTGGFRDRDGLILKTIFRARQAGEAELAFADDFSIFLSDGKGTKTTLRARPLSLSIIERPPEVSPKDEWSDFIAQDTALPEFVEAIISKDQRVFEGRYFVSFFATDRDSGVAYYEVKEGELDFVRATSPYVLQDQTLKGSVLVKAVDGAGNESVIIAEIALVPAPFYKSSIFWIIIILIIIGVLFVKFQITNTKSQTNSNV